MHEIQKGADVMKNQPKEKMLSLVILKRITGMQQNSWRSDQCQGCKDASGRWGIFGAVGETEKGSAAGNL